MARRMIAFLFCIAFAGVSAAQGDASIARLQQFEGDVSVIRAGRSLTLSTGLSLDSDDIIQTEAGSAHVVFDDGSTLDISPKTRVSVRQTGEERDVNVVVGRLRAFVQKFRNRKSSFRTGGTIAAVRGTVIEYMVMADGSVKIGVVSGAISITWPGATTAFTLVAGQSTIVAASSAALTATSFTAGSIAGAVGGVAAGTVTTGAAIGTTVLSIAGATIAVAAPAAITGADENVVRISP